MKRLSTKTPKALLRKTYHWFTKTRRRKILSSFLALLILLSSIRIWYWFNPKKVKAATMQLTTTSSTVQIDVANRYRAIMQTGDTDDYLLIYDRAQNDSSPNPTHEFKGPCILETNTYCLRDDANRITTILESNAVRVRVRVEGKFNNEASTDYLDDESAAPILLTVIEDYTFTTEGVFVSNMTDFKTTGVTLDADSGHNGYEWLAVYSDVTDAAFNEGAIPDIIYGDGNTEVNNANQVDGVEFEDSNKYVVLPGTTGYQYGFVGIQGAGWFDGNATAAVDEWNWDENETSSGGTTQDLIAAQEQNGSTATLGKHYAKWFFLMLASGDLDSEDEREAYINDFRNPDILDFTTGDEWSFEDDSDLEGFWKMEEDGSTAAADSSSRGNNLTVSASDTIPRSTDAREGTYSRDFEYDDLDFMSLADGSQQGLDVSGDLTLSLWVKPEDALTVRLIDKSTSFNNNVAYSLGYDSSMNLYFAVSSAGNNQVELKPGASEITRGAWQHVVAVVDVDKALTFYINNIGVGSTAYTLGSIYNSSADFSLGGRAGTAYSDYLLDEVAVFSRALSLVEIDQIYKQGIKSHYNQAEAIYTVDAAGSQIELDIDGGSNVSNTLAGAESAGDTSIILTSSDDFPDGGGSTTYYAYINGDKFSFNDNDTATETLSGIPSSGELSVVGHAIGTVVSSMNRHKPMFKIRKYRSIDPPDEAVLEGDRLQKDYDFIADVKPISDAYFADELTWYSTMESSGAVTSPDVGSAGSVTLATFTTGKYGNGLLVDANGEYASFPLSGNVDASVGTIEYWYKNTTTPDQWGAFFSHSQLDNYFQLQRNDNNTSMTLHVNNSTTSTWTTPDVYDGGWHHIRLTYDFTNNSTYLYVDGVNRGESTTDHASIPISTYSLQIGTSDDMVNGANGVIDEFRVYIPMAGAIDKLAQGGNTADSSEYLFSESQDYTLDFEPVDASNRGEYVFFSADSMFSGINVDLETVGATGGTLNLDWEYWNGTSWASLESISGFTDGTSNLTQDGAVYWSANPTNWRKYSVNGSTDLYYIRASLNASSGTYTTSPVENLIKTDILLFQYTRYDGSISAENRTFEIPGYTANSPPIAYWALDEGYSTTANDRSGHNNPGTITNATWQTEDLCLSGKCLHFDGDGDYVSRADDSQFDFDENRSFTIEGWFRHPEISTSADVLAAKYESTGSDGGYKIQMESDGDISFGIDDDNTSFPEDSATSTSADYDDNQWHHIVATKSDTSNIVLYLDGQLIDTDSSIGSTETLENNDPFYVGIAGDGVSNDFDGFIDEVKVYRYARSADEVKADFIKGSSTKGSSAAFGDNDAWLSDGLVGYWKMDESSDGSGAVTRVDSSGNGNDLTDASPYAASGTGKFGNGGEFELDNSEYLSIADATQTGLDLSNSLTFSSWFKLESSALTGPILIKADGDGTHSYDFRINGNNAVWLRWEADTGNGWSSFDVNIWSADGLVTDGEWTYLAITYDGSTIRLFKDGVEQTSGDFPYTWGGSLYNSAGAFRIGGGWDGAGQRYFDGLIDEVRVYNRAFTPSEVEGLYNWAPGPVGWWKLDEHSDGTNAVTRYDSSGNENNLTDLNTTESGIGKYGKSGNFNDTDNTKLYITDANQTGLEVTKPVTAEAWVYRKPGAITSSRYIAGKWDVGTATQRSYVLTAYQLGQAYYAMFCVSSDGSALTCTTGATALIATSGWIHWTGVYDGNTVQVYVNGVPDNASPASFSSDLYSGSADFYVGGVYWNAGSVSGVFEGKIDDVRIYNYARTQEQIIEDMNAGHPAPGSPVGSPVAQFKFDETYGTTAQDSSDNNNDLTLSSASWTTSGKFGSAWNGTGALWVSRADDSDFDFSATDNFSISGWFKSDSATNPAATEYLVNKANATTAGYAVYANTSGQLCFGIDDDAAWGPDIASCSTTDFYDGTWHHLLAVRDHTSSDKTYIYIDGVERDSDSDTTTATLANALSLYLGDRDGVDNGDEFNGNLDEIKFYRFALTADQVKVDYNMGMATVMGSTSIDSSNNPLYSSSSSYCPPGTSCNSPIAEWKLDENTGTINVYDSSGNGFDGLLYDATQNPWERWIPGKHGSALDFNGGERVYVVVAQDSLLDLAGVPVTINLWFRAPSTYSYGYPRLLRRGTFGADQQYFVMLTEASRSATFTYGNQSVTTANAIYEYDDWTHLTAVYDNSDMKLYFNGTEVASDTESVTAAAATYPINIGAESFTGTYHDFDGDIDDVRIYNYARTPAQIAWDYNRGKPVGWWKLDECTGTTAYDSSTNGNGDSNGNTGAITIGATGDNTTAGTCSSGTGTEAWNNGTTGKRNASLDFDGTDDYVYITNASEVDLNEGLKNGFTWVAWVYANSDGLNNAGRIFAKTNAGASFLRVGNEISGNLDLVGQLDLATSDASLTISSAIRINTWHHVAISWTDDADDEITIWVDGKAMGTSTNGSGSPTADTANFQIGGSPLAYFDGQIDDVKIYNYVLTDKQIKTEYNAGTVRFGP